MSFGTTHRPHSPGGFVFKGLGDGLRDGRRDFCVAFGSIVGNLEVESLEDLALGLLEREAGLQPVQTGFDAAGSTQHYGPSPFCRRAMGRGVRPRNSTCVGEDQ